MKNKKTLKYIFMLGGLFFIYTFFGLSLAFLIRIFMSLMIMMGFVLVYRMAKKVYRMLMNQEGLIPKHLYRIFNR